MLFTGAFTHARPARPQQRTTAKRLLARLLEAGYVHVVSLRDEQVVAVVVSEPVHDDSLLRGRDLVGALLALLHLEEVPRHHEL